MAIGGEIFHKFPLNKGLRLVEGSKVVVKPIMEEKQETTPLPALLRGNFQQLTDINKSPALLEWVLRKDYFDYKLPDIERVP